ncbi:DUF1811 family protein [Lederbergia galactosidilytica]|uniref:DUF1811 family protein n=1 Tax=Lederbergia galactosidilytica TaxID=217031 RepID=A0A0Q9XU95_9BACI|nr:DUF1811 family protein [Lederbergia galactosidilytica]KRG11846.1 hypothetical protein ACA29_13945 [Lederbergia galactosidilytica]KRG16309.1 hypothetical protein ACA30_00920 [Virgibacillus soli]MBP1915121.1 hypothetical protein [Lederbergia galactosidilytica]
MAHPYKTYSHQQLQEEVEILKEKLKQAQLEDRTNHILVYTRKIELVQSFMLNPDDFQPGDIFEIIQEPDYLFEIIEISGVTAWGYKIYKGDGKKDHEQRGKLLAQLRQTTECI